MRPTKSHNQPDVINKRHPKVKRVLYDERSMPINSTIFSFEIMKNLFYFFNIELCFDVQAGMPFN
jgi:hypothetical protein